MYTSMNAATAKKSGDKSDDSGNSKDSDSGGEWLEASRSDSDSSNGDNNKDKSSNTSSDSVGSMISGSNPTTKASEVPG